MKIRIFILLLLNSTFIYSQSLFHSRGIGGGGALFFPTVNPANENEFYVSCDMSELFHSNDSGRNYDQLPFTSLQVFNTSTYGFTNNNLIAYSNFNDGNNGYPVKTMDGGLSWQSLPGYNVNTYGKVYKIENNYNDPQQLIIGAYGDILFSNDGGNSFSLIHHATNMGAGLIISGVWWDQAEIFIATNEGIFHSTNAGNTFALLSTTGILSGQVIWNFAAAKSGSTTRFVCITAASADVYNGVMPWDYYNFAKGVYTMDNASGNWINRSASFNFANDFIMYSTMARNDISTIYLGGHDNALGAPLVYGSHDGGNTFSKLFNTTSNANIITGWEGSGGDKQWSWSETVFGITAAPNNSNKVYFGNYSNVQVSDNGGTTWRQAYVNQNDEHSASQPTPTHRAYHSIGLENTTCWQVFWYDRDTMIGAFSDIGCIRSKDAGAAWGFQYSGLSVNSLYRVVKSSTGILFGACSNIHDMYQSTRLADAQLDANDGNGKIVYSIDGGNNWSLMHLFNHPVFWLATDPTNSNRLYASVIHYGAGSGQGGIWVCNNIGSLAAATWTKLSNPPRTEGHPACIQVLNDGKVVCTYSGRRNSSGVFTASSGVFIYDPVAGTWTDASAPGMYYWTKDLVVDPSDQLQNTFYVCVFSGWGGAPNGLGGLYKTIDRGQNWIKLTGSQFDRVTSITFDPTDLGSVFMTTETQGLWKTSNIHLLPPTFTLVNSYPFRQPERVYFNPYNTDEVWISSFGNGMKVTSMSQLNFITSEITQADFSVYPNPFVNELNIRAYSSNDDLMIFNSLGIKMGQWKLNQDLTKIQTPNWPNGVYYVIISGRVKNIIKLGE